MELCIGVKLRQLRRARELTQEEAAARLGVSFQAISKWERGEGYPDITMLPTLANFYGVSADELLGMEEMATAARYDEINKKWHENRLAGLHEENVALMRDALRLFPGDALLMVQLGASLHRCGRIMESIEVQEQILKHCDDCEVRGATLYNLCFSYEKAGMHENALIQARKLPNLYKARENALALIADGDEKLEASRAALEPLKWALGVHLKVIAEAEGREDIAEMEAEITGMLERIQA